jgi:hypothetical protein
LNSHNDDIKSKASQHAIEKPPALISHCIKSFRQKGLSILADMRKDEQALFVNWAQNVVDRYGTLLQKSPAKIKNIADLPCPKEDLKIAIKALLPAFLEKGSDDAVGLLKDRYVRLSEFQEIRQEDVDIIVKGAARSDQKPELTDASLFATYQQYMQIVISEQTILLEDISTFISDL